MGPKGRHAKSKARLSNYDKLASEETKDREEKLELFIPPGPRLGNVVIEANNVTKAYGDKVLFDNLNFSLPPQVLWVSLAPMAQVKPPCSV
jgi:sulfate-transporting ATPase